MTRAPWLVYVVEAVAVLGFQVWVSTGIDSWGHFLVGFLCALCFYHALVVREHQR